MAQTLSHSGDDIIGQTRTQRLVSIDLLRGLVMVLMALDHVRSFFSNARFDPLDLTKTNIPLFLTRWITHFCAPSFIFLAGIAAYLSFSRHKNKQSLTHLLLTRGLWLVLLELTVVRFGWFFNLNYRISSAGILWAIGWSMVVLAALVHLPKRAIAAISISLIVGHNLFDGLHSEQLGAFGGIWAILHEQKTLQILPGINFRTHYPLIPWIGVMAAGYVFGRVFDLEKSQRRQILRTVGLSLIIFFIILRAINIYGDPQPWSVQPNIAYTILSFLNCDKYPPSLLFLLMTLGPAILLLDLFANPTLYRFFKPLALFGKVPLFFYIIHIPLIHLSAIILAIFKYGSGAFTLKPTQMPADYGYSLPIVYYIWLIILLLLYPICNWFAERKAKSRSWWLKYL